MASWLSDSRALYTGLVALVAVQRLVELRISQRNTAALLDRGGVEVGRSHYPWMVLLHTSFLIACPLEVWGLERPFLPALALGTLLGLVTATALRGWVMATLGERWSTRVVCLPGVPRIDTGPYRHLRHPNYLAVVIEMAALPLLHTAWLSALIFSCANLLLLGERVRVEERALERYAESRNA